MSLLKDAKMTPVYCRPGDTLSIFFNIELLVSESILCERMVDRVMIFNDADPLYFKNGYRVEFGESL